MTERRRVRDLGRKLRRTKTGKRNGRAAVAVVAIVALLGAIAIGVLVTADRVGDAQARAAEAVSDSLENQEELLIAQERLLQRMGQLVDQNEALRRRVAQLTEFITEQGLEPPAGESPSSVTDGSQGPPGKPGKTGPPGKEGPPGATDGGGNGEGGNGEPPPSPAPLPDDEPPDDPGEICIPLVNVCV